MRPQHIVAAALSWLVLVLLAPAPVQAGHGLMNAFSDIEWLPAPGRTPDEAGYALDTLAERARLALSSGAARLALAQEFAREKLAEVEAMVVAGDGAAAHVAIDAYIGYLDEANAALDEIAPARQADAAARFATALLEHQYLVSVGYLDLPRDTREVIADVVAAAAARYAALQTRLSPAFRAAQFFKEEEVRWSWEMARQGDAQGL